MRNLYALGICLFLLAAGGILAQQQKPQQSQQPSQSTTPSAKAPAAQVPHPLVITPEEKALKNPVRFTVQSVEKGKRLYMTQCAMCHGANGNGKSSLAAVMHITPPDFTNPKTLSKRTDGELFTIIDKGSGSMPSQGSRFKKDQTWDLVNYLRSLEGKKPGRFHKTRARSARR